MDLVFSLIPAGDGDFEKERRRNAKVRYRTPKGVKIIEKDLNGFPAEYISRKGNDRGIIFYIHGGGFTTGSAYERRGITLYLVSKCAYDCISVNYSLAPENKWPKPLDDCFTAYENVLKEYEAKDIVLMGESAGGTLVLSLGLMIRDKGLDMPAAIVSFSPASDQYTDLPSHKGNISTDYMLKDAVSKGLARVLFDHEPSEEELKDPYLSPYYGDYEGVAPIFLSASDTETLYDDALTLYEKLREAGHKVKMSVGHKLVHAYAILPFMPEARKCIKEALDFIDEL